MASFSSQRLPLPNNGIPSALFTSSGVGFFVPSEAVVGVEAAMGVRAGAGVGIAVTVGALTGSSERLSLEMANGASPFVRATMYPSADSETKITWVPEGTVMKPIGRPSLVRSIRELVRRVPPRVDSEVLADWAERELITPGPERSRTGRSVISPNAWAWRHFIDRLMLPLDFS
jgi:hypothetical protein